MIKEKIAIRLIDMNSFSIDNEIDIDVQSELFDALNSYVNFFKEKGLEFSLSEVKISNTDKFYEWILKRLYPEYDIEDHQKDGGGVPDFKLIKKSKEDWIKVGGIQKKYYNEVRLLSTNDEWTLNKFNSKPLIIWIEIKRNNDGLRGSQFDWILNNRGKEIIKILFIKEDNMR